MFAEAQFLTLASGRYGTELVRRYTKRLNSHPYSQSIPTVKEMPQFADDLYQEILERRYHPQPPVGYLVADKHQGVPRILPILRFEDLFVYSFCVYCIQEALSAGRVDGTYGGWQMSNDMRRRERDEKRDEELGIGEPEYLPYGAINEYAWRKYWKEFQEKAYDAAKDETLPFVVKFDIANFYDSVVLNTLKRKLRQACGSSNEEVIDLLLAFLGAWNRGFEGYNEKNVGIPMDIVGDSSRILANFYLQEYDRVMARYVSEELGGRYLRYTDDQLILLPDETQRAQALVRSGIELHKAGLSINSGKVLLFDTFDDYSHYWCFSQFEMIGDGSSRVALERAVSYFFCLVDAREDTRPWRMPSVLKRLLGTCTKGIDARLRQRLVEFALLEENLCHLNAFLLGKLYELTEKDDQDKLLADLEASALSSSFSQFVLHVKEFFASRGQERFVGRLNEKLQDLAGFYGQVGSIRY